jgi:transposase-like protein
MNCIHCQSEAIVKNGTKTLKTGQVLQQYLCNTWGRRPIALLPPSHI